MLACSAMSIAYGREVGMIFVIYIMALAYAACSPMILPFTLCYFLSAWVRFFTNTHSSEICALHKPYSLMAITLRCAFTTADVVRAM